MGAAHRDAEQVLDFWFGELGPHGFAADEVEARWWRADPAFDQLLRDRFGALHAAVAAGRRAEWLASPRGRLAAILVLDQFTRNLFRGSARMYACDPLALEAARAGVDLGMDRALSGDPRVFFTMPFQHSEELADQERSVQLLAAHRDELPEPDRARLDSALRHAEEHRDTVRRFGRFPHRNALLGRASSPDEVAFLDRAGRAGI
jgi:uncharacterized protein (DUF924 family)